MWTNQLISNNNGEIHVEFTSSSGNKFTKIYKGVDDVDTFLTDKLSDIEILTTTYQILCSYVNVDSEICVDWKYKITYISMPADWVEVFIDVISPNQTLSKMFSITAPRTIEYVEAFMQSESQKIADMVEVNDVDGLSNYFGQEVTV